MQERDFELLVNRIRTGAGAGALLTALLHERHQVYEGKSTAAVNRMRGYVYCSYSFTSTPDNALDYLFEEMESGDNAYTIAAAAIALRYARSRTVEMAALLMKGLNRAIQHNGYISFDSYRQKWPLENRTSTIEEVLKTIGSMGSLASSHLSDLELLEGNIYGRLNDENVASIKMVIEQIRRAGEDSGDCCNYFSPKVPRHLKPRSGRYYCRSKREHILLQDQEGGSVSLEQLFRDKYHLVAFFYTRCENPAKCSLTISNLAALQDKLREKGYSDAVNLSAISYDSVHDNPAVLKAYGSARGLKLNGRARMLRVVSNFNGVSDYFDLSVNFAGPLVNRHTIELYLINRDGVIVERFERRQMNNDLIIARIIYRVNRDMRLSRSVISGVRRTFSKATALIIPILFTLFPKCPFCLAAYLSVFGITGLQLSPYYKLLLPIVVLAMLVNLYALYRMGVKKGSFMPLLLCMSGTVMVAIFRYVIINPAASIFGFILLFSGVILNGIPIKYRLWLRYPWRFAEKI